METLEESVQTPPTLQKLASQTMLRDEPLAISSLEDQLTGLFPALLKEACAGRQSKLVKAIVADWLFPYLPMRTLIEKHNLKIFQAVLH